MYGEMFNAHPLSKLFIIQYKLRWMTEKKKNGIFKYAMWFVICIGKYAYSAKINIKSFYKCSILNQIIIIKSQNVITVH